jgi:hypothetical protein
MNLLNVIDSDCNILLRNNELFNKKLYFTEPNFGYEIISISLQEVKNITDFKSNIELYRKIFPTTYIRIYTNKEYDNETFINEYKDKEYMQIIKYNYSLFGKKYINNLIKYEPLFNFEESLNIIFVQILDPNTDKINISGYDKFKNNETKFYFVTSSSHYLSNNLYSLKDFSLTWCRINDYGIMTKLKFPCFIYSGYIKMLSNTINKDNEFTINDVTQMYYEYYKIYENNNIKDKYQELLLYVLINYISLANIDFSYYYIPNYTRLLLHLKNKKCNKIKFFLKNILKEDYNDKENTNNNYFKLFNILKKHKDKKYIKYVNNLIYFCVKQLEHDSYNEFCMTKDFPESIVRTLYISLIPKDYVISDQKTLYSFDAL